MSMTAAEIVSAMTTAKSSYDAFWSTLSSNSAFTTPVETSIKQAIETETDLIVIGFDIFLDETAVQNIMDSATSSVASMIYYMQNLVYNLQGYLYYIEGIYITDAGNGSLSTLYNNLSDILANL